MVWGMILKGAKATGTVDLETKVRITNIALFKVLEAPVSHQEGDVKVWINFSGADRLLCILSPMSPNVKVDIVFDYGDEISFRLEGEGSVHMTGNYEEDDYEGSSESPPSSAGCNCSGNIPEETVEQQVAQAAARLQEMRVSREHPSRRARIDQFRLLRRK